MGDVLVTIIMMILPCVIGAGCDVVNTTLISLLTKRHLSPANFFASCSNLSFFR